jgi:hypothetical protein
MSSVTNPSLPVVPGYCGAGDIFAARFGRDLTVDAVEHLGCDVNSAFDEHSPYPTNIPGVGPVLFYSSARPLDAADTAGDHDLYMSTSHGGVYQAGAGWGCGAGRPKF